MKRLQMVALGLAIGLLSAPGTVRAQTPELSPLPEMRLEGAAEPVREVMTQARTRVEEAIAGDVPDVVLAEAFGHLADVSFAHEMSAQARIAYRNAISLRPERQEWHYLLGLVAIGEGDLDAGIEALSGALELYGRDHAALIHRGRAWLDKGEVARAAQDFSRARRLAPGSAAVLAGLGRVALERGEYRKAADLFHEVADLVPAADQVQHLLGMAYRGLGEVERAREHLSRSGETPVPMADPVLDRVRMQSRSPQFYLELGLGRADAGDLAGADEALAKARELAPDDPEIIRNHGDVLARMDRLEEARAAFERLAALMPDQARPHFYLGQLHELAGNLTAALDAYEQALAHDPDHADAIEGRAFVLIAAGQPDQALAAFSRLAEQAGGAAETARFRYWEALVSLSLGDCARGLASLNRAASSIDGPDASVQMALVRAQAVCHPDRENELGQYLETAESLYRERPDTETAATMAMLQAARGEFDQAMDYQAQAVFEALKAGELEQQPQLRQNLQRYEDGQTARLAYDPAEIAAKTRVGGNQGTPE